MSASRVVFVYDEDCGFCTRFVDVVRARCANRVKFLASRRYEGPGAEMTESAAILVAEGGGDIRAGAAAIGRLLRMTDSAALGVAGCLIESHWILPVSSWVYSWVACHRGVISSGCSIS